MRRIREHERESRERGEGSAPAPISHAARIIALQRTAGNHAVAAMIARDAAPRQAEPTYGLAVLDGIGTIPLLSVSYAEPQRGTGAQPVELHDVQVMSKVGEHSSQLQRAAQQGEAFEAEVLAGDKVRLKLHKAAITAFSEGDGHGGEAIDSWTLNAANIELVTDER